MDASQCVCGPHPRIDLTVPYIKYHERRNGSGDGINDRNAKNAVTIHQEEVREQIRQACLSHGCFHVAIDVSPTTTETSTTAKDTTSAATVHLANLPIKCLAKCREEIEREVESLFTPTFLQNAVSNSIHSSPIDQHKTAMHFDEAYERSGSKEDNGKSTNSDLEWESICNGGMIEVPFTHTKHKYCNYRKQTDRNNHDAMKTTIMNATFRGRIAESGNEEEPNPEPKLSWEFQRCTAASAHPRQASSETSLDNQESLSDNIGKTTADTDRSNIEMWGHLPQWTNALHSIASVIIDLLGIPPRLVLQEQFCECDDSVNSHDADEGDVVGVNERKGRRSNCHTTCNIDLLRVFRYDALPHSPSPSRPPTSLGSSAHSDWGTLTVVWQDNKGGLQTYCHACDKWSDVDASTPLLTTFGPNNGNRGGVDDRDTSTNTAVHVFVHVGDFLSLATSSCLASGNLNKGGKPPVWPSPRHRVLCPIQRNTSNNLQVDMDGLNTEESNDNCVNDCRRSLVYFAYPPRQVSLVDVQRFVAPVASASDNDRSDHAISTTPFYSRYSLLHNQSHQSTQVNEEDASKDNVSNNVHNHNQTLDNNGIGLEELAAYQTYLHIKHTPFDEVIFEKWNQVQRK